MQDGKGIHLIPPSLVSETREKHPDSEQTLRFSVFGVRFVVIRLLLAAIESGWGAVLWFFVWLDHVAFQRMMDQQPTNSIPLDENGAREEMK